VAFSLPGDWRGRQSKAREGACPPLLRRKRSDDRIKARIAA
jgi:hypothetical protein